MCVPIVAKELSAVNFGNNFFVTFVIVLVGFCLF